MLAGLLPKPSKRGPVPFFPISSKPSPNLPGHGCVPRPDFVPFSASEAGGPAENGTKEIRGCTPLALQLGRGVPGREGPRRRVLIPWKGAQLPQRACNCGFGSRCVLESGSEAPGLALSWTPTFLPLGEVWGCAGTLLGAPHLPQPGFWCQNGAAWHELELQEMEHRGCRAFPRAARSLPRLPAAPQPPAPRPCSFPRPGGLVQAASESPRRCQAGGEAPEGAQDAGRWFWEVVLGSRERLRRVSLLLIRSSPLSTRHLEHPRAWWWGWAGRNIFLRPGGWMGASC